MWNASSIRRLVAGLSSFVAAQAYANVVSPVAGFSKYAQQEIAQAARASIRIDHGGDTWSRVTSGGGIHSLVQIVPENGALVKFAIPIAKSPARVTSLTTGAGGASSVGAMWPSETPWVAVTLVDEAIGVERTMTLAVTRRPVHFADLGWQLTDVRAQCAWVQTQNDDRTLLHLAPPEVDGVARTLRVESDGRVGTFRAKPGHGDILEFHTERKHLIVTTADQIERAYAMKKVRTSYYFEHREDRHRRKVVLIQPVRRVFAASVAKRRPPGDPPCQGPLGAPGSPATDSGI